MRVRSGYRPFYTILRWEGWKVNHKRVYRLYTEEGLTLKPRRPRRHRSAVARAARPAAQRRDEQWAMDFMHDTLADGRSVRVLTAIDVFSRECVALKAGSGFTGFDVVGILTAASRARGAQPDRITVDNGTEFTSKALDHWAYWNGIQLDFSRPGRPADNPFIEAFNGTLRRECLSQHWFISLEDAQRTLDTWRDDYNNARPHGSLGQEAPARFRAGEDRLKDQIRMPEMQT